MIKSLVIAFSTYSKIPMPMMEFKKEDMKYCMCFFGLVGAVIGIVCSLLIILGQSFGLPSIIVGVLMTVIPIWITGGIHLDGFIDTIDAKNSYKDKSAKLEILKDPHVGAFAIIHCIVYMLLYFAFSVVFFENIMLLDLNKESACPSKATLFIVSYAGIFVLSRILSAISVITFPKAKKEGMVSSMANSQENRGLYILIIELIVLLSLELYVSQGCFLWCLIPAILVFAYYWKMSKKIFGGITGDLAGYFLQVMELVCLIALTIGSYIC